MMVASAQVISHRTHRMASAVVRPNARDHREFAMMGQEKVDACAASFSAMTSHLFTMNARLGIAGLRQVSAHANAMMSLAGSRDMREALQRQAQLLRTLQESGSAALQMSHSAARIAHAGIRPVHARATANARRLAREALRGG